MTSTEKELAYADARTIAAEAGINGTDPTSDTALWKTKVSKCATQAERRVGKLNPDHVRTLVCAIVVAARSSTGEPRPYGFGGIIKSIVAAGLQQNG